MITSILIDAFCGFLAGLLIGTVGIGGVILVPLLVYLGEADIYQSITAAICSFFISGIVGTVIYARRGVIEWPLMRSLFAGALPGTLAGTYLLVHVNEIALKMLIAVLMVLSGAGELWAISRHRPKGAFNPTSGKLVGIGAITGVLSALTGTGGPLILIPLLVFVSAPMVLAIGLAQVIQLPVSIIATAGNMLNNMIDWQMALAIATGVAIGSFIGASLSGRIPAATLRKSVAALLFTSGMLMVVSLLY